MAVSRFWNQAPVAQYDPMSMQELAYAPSIMYQRDKDLSGQVDAMNDAATSLKSALGPQAPVTDNWNQQYQSFLKSMNEQGATPQNIDRAKQLRQTYMNQVQPMQQFADQRQQVRQQEIQQESDPDKIRLSDSALNTNFNDWNKSNRTLTPAKYESRTALMQLGHLAGQQYADSNLRLLRVDPETETGIYTSGLSSADQAEKLDNPDTEYGKYLNTTAQSLLQAKGGGVNPEALNAIKQGIKIGSVGKEHMEKLSAAAIRAHMGAAEAGLPQSPDINMLNIESNPLATNTNPETSYKVDKDIALKTPEYASAYNQSISKLSGGQFNSLDDLKIAKQKISTYIANSKLLSTSDRIPRPSISTSPEDYDEDGELTREAANRLSSSDSRTSPEDYDEDGELTIKALNRLLSSDSHTFARPSIKQKLNDLNRLNSIESKADENFYGSSGWDHATSYSIGPIGRTYGSPQAIKQMKDQIDATGEEISNAIPGLIDSPSGYGGTSPESNKALKDYVSSNDPNKHVEFKNVRFNGKINKDSMGRIINTTGTGQASNIVKLVYKDSNKKDQSKDVSIALDPETQARVMGPIFSTAKQYSPNEQLPSLQTNWKLYQKYLVDKEQVERERIQQQQSK